MQVLQGRVDNITREQDTEAGNPVFTVDLIGETGARAFVQTKPDAAIAHINIRNHLHRSVDVITDDNGDVVHIEPQHRLMLRISPLNHLVALCPCGWRHNEPLPENDRAGVLTARASASSAYAAHFA